MNFRVVVFFAIILCMMHSAFCGNVEWDSRSIELVAQPEDSGVDAVFKFSALDQPFSIKTIRSSCGCTTTHLDKKTYLPGESGEIKVHFEIGARVGAQKKYVMLETNDPDNPQVQLEINVYIPHLLKIEPRFVYWTKGQTQYKSQDIKLTFDVDRPIRISSVTSDQEQLQVNLEQITDHEYHIHLQPDISEGEMPFFRAVIKIEIESDFPMKQRIFYAYAFMKS